VKLSPIHRRIGRVLLAGFVIVFCVFFFRGVDWHTLAGALVAARWQLIVLAGVINFIHLLVKAARWGVLLSPVGRVGLLPLYRYTLGGYAASNILPVRFGEVLRVFYLRPHGIPAAGAAGVQVLEKVYEMVGLLLLVLPLPLALALPARAAQSIAALAAVGLVATVVMVAMALSHRRRRTGLLARVSDGMAVLRQPRAALWALVLSIVVWLLDTGEVMLVLSAVGLPSGFFGAVLVLLFINFAIAAPSTPAQLGAFEAGAVFALNLLGAPTEKALAFALLYHFMQAIPVTIAGLEGVLLWRSLGRVPAPGEAAAVVEQPPA
jgi:uncharacterized membrane protein YbhN (UPF0104 family)